MGYRSDLGIAIQKDAFLKHTLLTKHSIPEMLLGADKSNYPECMKDDCYTVVYFFISSVKYYDGYEDVDELDNFLERIEEDPDHDEKSDASYGFLRMGENDDDIETRGDPYQYDIYVERHIDLPLELS